MDKKSILIPLLITFLLMAVAIYGGDSADKKYKIEELSQFDGSEGKKAFIAIDGIIYDVTLIKAWAGGKHKKGLQAGKDHSSQIDRSPHGRKVLKKLPKVGMLQTK